MNGIQQITPGSSEPAKWAQLNKNLARMDREVVTKVFKVGDTELIQGKVDDVRFGTLMREGGVDRIFDGLYRAGRFGRIGYDDDGVPVSLDGQAPDDGRMGSWSTAPGENVLTLLGG